MQSYQNLAYVVLLMFIEDRFTIDDSMNVIATFSRLVRKGK